MILPDFVIGGGVASGTSFLSGALATHPEIYLPKVQRPEPNFFHYSWKYDQGLQWYSDTLFSDVDGEKVIGERSSLLLNSPFAAQRMKKDIGDARLIFCLRNPIERAWANYRFSVLEGLDPLPFDAAIASEEARMKAAQGKWAEVQPNAYVTRSRYAERLEEYVQLFGREQILFISSEEMGRKPMETIARVCRFVGADPDGSVELPGNYTSPNVIDGQVQKELRDYFEGRFSELVECIRMDLDMEPLLETDQDRLNAKRLKENLTTGKMPLSDDNRALLRDMLAEEIERVGQIVDFSVEHWT